MKKIFASIVICLLTTGHLYSQSYPPPYISYIKIIPINPTTSDTINVITRRVTANWSIIVSYNFTQQANTFNFMGCFNEGDATTPFIYNDTTSIGVLPAGAYNICYIAKQTTQELICLETDSNFMVTTFQVIKSGIENINTSCKQACIYPNPFQNKLTVQVIDSTSSEILLYDITSRKILQQNFTNTLTLNTSQLSKGIYIYEVRNKNGLVKKG